MIRVGRVLRFHELAILMNIVASVFNSQRAEADCITRPAQYWFTHPDNPAAPGDPTSATLLNALTNALTLNGGAIDLGFLTLPVQFENADNVKDVNDALIEALGLYWRSVKKT